MWSSDAAEANSHSSSSSSSSVFPKRKTMEEVWKDISLPTLGQDMSSRPSTPSLSLEAPLPHKSASASASTARPSFRGMILQDFLAGAFKDPPPSANASSELGHPPLPPPTALSLSTSAALRHAFHYSAFRPAPAPPTTSNSAAGASDRIPCTANSSAALFFSANKLIGDDPSCISTGDRRYKRMIKNRESAARSRARKQAYTNELELKVAHLTEENTKLKKQNEELRLAMAAQLPKRKALHRTSSAPF